MIAIPFRATRLAAVFAAPLLGGVASAADTTAPPTPVGSVTDTYYGITVPDPYRWMEDMKSAGWQACLKAQAAHADAVLARIPDRDAMRKRLAELADAGALMGTVAQRGGRLFYVKTEQGRNNRRLFMREGTAGTETLLLDPDELPSETGHHNIDV